MSNQEIWGLKSRRLIRLTLAAVVSSGLLAACSGSDDPESSSGTTEIQLSLDWNTYTAYHAPLAVAIENDLFEKRGVRVTESMSGGSGDAVLRVGSSKVDIAWADLTTAAASMLQGLPVKSVAKVQDKNASGLTVLDGTKLEAAEDVVGLRIGSTPGGSDATLISAFLNANDLSKDDVEIVNLPANGKFAALMSGDIDAVSGQVYFYVSAVQAQGKKAHGISYSDLGLKVLDHGFVASDKFIKSSPSAITAFLESYKEALAMTVDDPGAACQILAAKSDGAVVKDQCVRELRLWLPLTTPPDDKEWGRNDISEWRETLDVLVKYGDATGDRAPKTMFTNDFLPTTG